jgi:hypothetical protein
MHRLTHRPGTLRRASRLIRNEDTRARRQEEPAYSARSNEVLPAAGAR